MKFGKKMTQFISVVLAAASLTACGSAQTAKKNDSFTLTVGGWPPQEQPDSVKLFEDIKAEIEAKIPGLTIIPYTAEITLDNYFAEAASGQLPDLYDMPFTEPKKIIDAGFAADVTSEMKARGYDKALKPSILDIVTKDGKYYGVPFKGYSMSLYCNKNLFEQAGLVNSDGTLMFPDTWEELAETAKIIKDKTGKNGFAMQTIDKLGGFMFMNIAWAYGTQFEVEEDGKWVTHLNDPEGVAALQYIKDLKWKYDVLPSNILLDGSDVDKMYAMDEVAMLIGCYDEKTIPGPIIKYNMDKDNMVATVLPKGPKERSSQLGGTAHMMKKGLSEQQINAAFEWMEMRGQGIKMTDEAFEKKRKDMDAIIAERGEKAFIVKSAFSVWDSGEKKEKTDALYDEKSTVNKKNFETMYDEKNEVTFRREETYYCQQLYGLMSVAIQNVLMDKNADPQKEMDDVAKKFQAQFLDQLN